jgi:hypothetical protein
MHMVQKRSEGCGTATMQQQQQGRNCVGLRQPAHKVAAVRELAGDAHCELACHVLAQHPVAPGAT